MPGDVSSSLTSRQTEARNIPSRPAQPPCDNAWYEKFYKYHKAQKIHYDRKGSKKLARGLGLRDRQGEAIVARTRGLLPKDRCFDMKGWEGRTLQQTVAQQLLANPDVGPLRQPKFPASHLLATRFFTEAASRWVLVANVENREAEITRRARTRPPSPDAPSEAHGARQALANAAQIGPRSVAYNQRLLWDKIHEAAADFPEPLAVTHPHTPPQDAGADQTTPLCQNGQEDVVVIISDDEYEEDEIKKEEGMDTDTASSITQQHSTQPDTTLSANRLELRELGNPGIFTVAFLDDLFGTENTPLPSQVFLKPVVAYWNDHLLLRGLPIVDAAEIRFKFFSPGRELGIKEVGINNDVNLRVAYRLWLSSGNVNGPFVVFVDNV